LNQAGGRKNHKKILKKKREEKLLKSEQRGGDREERRRGGRIENSTKRGGNFRFIGFGGQDWHVEIRKCPNSKRWG